MAIDLLTIGILSRAGWFFLGLGVAFLLFRQAWRPGAGVLGKGARWATFGSAATVVLGVTLVIGWQSCFVESGSLIRGAGESVVGSAVSGALGEAGATITELIALHGADSEEELRQAGQKIAARLSREGMSRDDIREVMLEVIETEGKPWAYNAIESVVEGLPGSMQVDSAAPATEIATDSLAIAYAGALRSQDSTELARLQPLLAEAVAGDRITGEEAEIRSLRARNARLEDRLDEAAKAREEAEDRGLIRTLLKLADEVGIGFGWAGLYFTVLVTVWRGATLGKRLMRIRIVRLDGKPIGWWAAFNRFGGYAASIFTGLLGFFEMFWDANRQALHDRIAATVVVKE